MNLSDPSLKANLSIILRSVRGTKQYWFARKGELECIVRNAGALTLFLTLGCAEYEAEDICKYLRKVNPDVPSSYNIGKLCTEDPVSVFRQFSNRFHAFFQEVLIKGKVFGTVSQYYWRKEYQMQGAPHYHCLV